MESGDWMKFNNFLHVSAHFMDKYKQHKWKQLFHSIADMPIWLWNDPVKVFWTPWKTMQGSSANQHIAPFSFSWGSYTKLAVIQA